MTAYPEWIEQAQRKGADRAVSKEVFNDSDQLERLLEEVLRKVRQAHPGIPSRPRSPNAKNRCFA